MGGARILFVFFFRQYKNHKNTVEICLEKIIIDILCFYQFSDIEERVTNLKGFDTDLVIDATVRCLEIIRPGLGISKVLPANMAARFRVGAALAQACSVIINKKTIKVFPGNFLVFLIWILHLDAPLGIRVQRGHWLSNIPVQLRNGSTKSFHVSR